MKNLILCIAFFCVAVLGAGDLMGQVVDGTLGQRFRSSRKTVRSPGSPRVADLPIEIDTSLSPTKTRFGTLRSSQEKDESELNGSQNKDEEDDEDLDLDLDLEPLEDEQQPTFQPFGEWPRKSIREISLNVRDTNTELPEDQSYQLQSSYRSGWTQFAARPKVFAWAAPNIRYQPLYFEDVALERYGQTFDCERFGLQKQELSSFAHFFKSAFLLPYHMRFDHPKSCDSPLGYCRPGNAVPYVRQRQWPWKTLR